MCHSVTATVGVSHNRMGVPCINIWGPKQATRTKILHIHDIFWCEPITHKAVLTQVYVL